MSKADGKCDCAAHGPNECICGAWDDAQRTTGEILRAVDEACTCGPVCVCLCESACACTHADRYARRQVYRLPERVRSQTGTGRGGEPDECCPACKVWHILYPSNND